MCLHDTIERCQKREAQKNRWGLLATFAVVAAMTMSLALAAAGGAVDEASRLAFERLADLAVTEPPVIRTSDLAAYSTNRLDYALNNGLAMTRGGRLWASWISGGDGSDSFTAASWSDDRGETWTDVKLVIDGHNGTITGRTNIIGTFWLDPDGVLHCFTDQSILHFDGRAGFWESVCRNPDDEAPIWSKPRRIGDGHVINKPIVRRNGDWVLSSYLNGTLANKAGTFPGAFPALDRERGATCWYSTDRGVTWEKRGTVLFPTDRDGRADWQESQVAESADGETLRVFARVIDGQRGRLMMSESVDGGRTWGKAHGLYSMDNTNARFQVMRLKSGRILFVKHGRPDRGAPAWQGRVKLTAYLSGDECATWRGGLQLDAGCGSYPDCCQAPDGTIYVTHDHERGGAAEIWLHRFTEEDVLAGKIVSPQGKLNLLVMRAMSSKKNRSMRSNEQKAQP